MLFLFQNEIIEHYFKSVIQNIREKEIDADLVQSCFLSNNCISHLILIGNLTFYSLNLSISYQIYQKSINTDANFFLLQPETFELYVLDTKSLRKKNIWISQAYKKNQTYNSKW